MRVRLTILLAVLVGDQLFADGYRILGLFPLNGPSHWVTMEPLMKGLAKRGHQVDVVSHFPLKKPIPNYTDISLLGSMPLSKNNMSAQDILNFTSNSMYNLAYQTGTKICDLLEHPKLRNLIENPPQDPPYDIFITELFMTPCYLAFGRHLKVPTVGVVTCKFHDWLNEVSGNPSALAYAPGLFTGYTDRMTFKERLMNFLITNWISMQIHYYTNAQLEYVKKYFGMDVPCIKDLYKDISLYLVNSHYSLHGIKPWAPAVVQVAGLHIQEDNEPLPPEVQKWLDESKHGFVYFTFGSMVNIESFSKDRIEIFYASFKKIAPVRVLMKVANREDLLPGLPENVMTQPWFSQLSVLKHKNIRAFITHGGLMGTQEAIYCGVPMIGIPLFGDQDLNIQNYVNKKMAISLNSIDDVTEKKLTMALNSIINDPTYRENTQTLSKLFRDRPASALDTSVYWIEYVGRYGNVLQSPALGLYWWQEQLLDVYAFIAAVVVAVLWIARFVLRKLKSLLCGGSRASARKDSAAIRAKKNK